MSEEEYLITRVRSYSKSEKMAAQRGEKSEKEKKESGAEGGETHVTPPFVTPDKPKSENDWWEMFKLIGATLSGVQQELVGLRDTRGKVDSLKSTFTTEWKDSIDDKLQVLEMCDNDKDFQIKLLTNTVIKQQQQLDDLQGKVTAAFNREIRPNLIIQGITEPKDETYETLVAAVGNFFKNQMEITEEIEILDAYRKGKRGLKDRTICIKLAHVSDKSVIFSNASNLKGKENIRKRLYFVKDDSNDVQQETSNYTRDLQAENKEMDEGLRKNIRVSRGKILVNNSMVQQKVSHMKISKMLKLNAHQLQEIMAVKTVDGGEHVEDQSEFFSFAQKSS